MGDNRAMMLMDRGGDNVRSRSAPRERSRGSGYEDNSSPTRYSSNNKDQRIHPAYSSSKRHRHSDVFARDWDGDTSGMKAFPGPSSRRWDPPPTNFLSDPEPLPDQSRIVPQAFPSQANDSGDSMRSRGAQSHNSNFMGFPTRSDPAGTWTPPEPVEPRSASNSYAPMMLASTEPWTQSGEDSINVDHGSNGHVMDESDKRFLNDWLEAADDGELDIYSCLGLSDICNWRDPHTQELLRNMLAVLLVQGVVPLIMLKTNLTEFSEDVRQKDMRFRVAGCILYIYAVWKMYEGSTDHCRSMIISRGFDCGVQMKFLFPAILGEIISSLVGLCLIVVLFVIFSQSNTIASLVMNAVAVNFLSEVDTEFVELNHHRQAREHMKTRFIRTRNPRTCFGRSLQFLLKLFIRVIKVGGTGLTGSALAFIFLFTHEPLMCEKMKLGEQLARIGLCPAEKVWTEMEE